MAVITEKELKQHIKSNNLGNVYFLFGDEKFLIKYYTEKIQDLTVSDKDSIFNFYSFNGDDLDIESLASAVNMVTFLSQKKLIRIMNLDLAKLSESNLKKFKSIIEDVPEETVLLISQTGVEVNIKKNKKWSSFIKFLGKYGNVCELKCLTKQDIRKILISWSKKFDVILRPEIADMVVDVCGTDLNILKNEVEKLCCFVGAGNEVKIDDANNILVKDLTSNVFALGKHIINRDADMAFKELDTLLYKKEEPIVILSILSSTYIDMYRTKIAIESGESSSNLTEYFDDYKGKTFKLDIAVKNSRKYSMKMIRESLELLKKADLKLKTSKLNKRIILERVITELIDIS